MAGKPRILTPPALLVEAYQEGRSVRTVAAMFVMSYGSAYNRLKAAGVLRKHGGYRRRAA